MIGKHLLLKYIKIGLVKWHNINPKKISALENGTISFKGLQHKKIKLKSNFYI